MSDLTHFDADGHAHMVDVSAKAETDRVAIAQGLVTVSPETLARIKAGTVEKGDVLGIARLAGIMGAKRTPDLIPLCHPISLTSVAVDLVTDEATSTITITATCRTMGKTGVEMEAMTAVSVAALTLYDMVKAMDRAITIGPLQLIHKSGGKSGVWNRSESA